MAKLSARRTRTTLAAAAIGGVAAVTAVEQSQAAQYEADTATYTVVGGDTLGAIAADASARLKALGVEGITYKEIAKENGIKNPSQIKLDQKIVVGKLLEAQAVAAAKVTKEDTTLAEVDDRSDAIIAQEAAMAALDAQEAAPKTVAASDATVTAAVAKATPAVLDVSAEDATHRARANFVQGIQVASATTVATDAVAADVAASAIVADKADKCEKLCEEAEAMKAMVDAAMVKLQEAKTKIEKFLEECAKQQAEAPKVEQPAVVAEQPKVEEPVAEKPAITSYTVVGGDNLCKIAEAHDYSAMAIFAQNPKAFGKTDGKLDPHNIKKGAVLNFAGLEKVKDKTECNDIPAREVSKPHIEPRKHVGGNVTGGWKKRNTPPRHETATCGDIESLPGYKLALQGVKSGQRPNALKEFAAKACSSEAPKKKGGWTWFGGGETSGNDTITHKGCQLIRSGDRYVVANTFNTCCEYTYSTVKVGGKKYKVINNRNGCDRGGEGVSSPPGDDNGGGGCSGGCGGGGNNGGGNNGGGNGGNSPPGGATAGAGAGVNNGADPGTNMSPENGGVSPADAAGAAQGNSDAADGVAAGSPFGFVEPKNYIKGVQYPGLNIA